MLFVLLDRSWLKVGSSCTFKPQIARSFHRHTRAIRNMGALTDLDAGCGRKRIGLALQSESPVSALATLIRVVDDERLAELTRSCFPTPFPDRHNASWSSSAITL